jgi:ribosome-associated heat shock protein Hsp15
MGQTRSTRTLRPRLNGTTIVSSIGRRVRLADEWPANDRRDIFSSRAILERVTDPIASDATRVDRWLCAVRLVKTRPLATRLCDGRHVLVNGSPAKPSTKVRAGDRVEALIADRMRIVEVVRPIESRVGAGVAATCYVDHSPPVVRESGPAITLVRGEGRPSKRLRRELDRLRRAADA